MGYLICLALSILLYSCNKANVEKKERIKESDIIVAPNYAEDLSSLADMLIGGKSLDEFRTKAEMISKNYRTKDLYELTALFHNPPKGLSQFDPNKLGLGSWMTACQFSIFEIYYNAGEGALPLIRKIAWGEYDWTQGNAIEVLIRLAATDVCREEIIAEIKDKFPKIRYEAQIYAIEPLISQLDKDKSLKVVFDELMVIEEFKESYDEIMEEKR